MPVPAKLYTYNDMDFNVISMSLAAWAVYYEMDEKSLRTRINKGWPIKRAITEPMRHAMSHPSARSKALSMFENVYNGRVHKECGTTLKYTRNGTCLNCAQGYDKRYKAKVKSS